MSVYTLADFAFDLPPELIAQAPAPTRTGSRLLHVDGARLADLHFADLPNLLRAGDLLVFNDTRVIKARVLAREPTGGKVEIMVERVVADDEAWVQLRASHAPAIGGTLLLPGTATATVVARDDRFWRLRFTGTERARRVARAARRHTAASVHCAAARTGRRRALPDRLCARARRRRGAHRRTAFRRADAGRACREAASRARSSRCTSAQARSRP